jgi:FlaA1/EpsC-like NDP-sugar epimerase
MADNIYTAPLRLRPSEYRSILWLGDLIMAITSLFVALYTWRRYNFYVTLADLLARGIPRIRAEIQAEVRNSIQPDFWFYLLPIAWMLLLVELYEPHVASSGRRTTRGIALAAFIGLVVYSLVFIVQVNPETNLPRVGVGAFLLLASLLTLLWRVIFIRIYKSTGQRRRVLLIGAGKAGHWLRSIIPWARSLST